MKRAKVLQLNGNDVNGSGADLVREAYDAGRDSKMWLYRKAGWSCYDIGLEMGLPTPTVRKCLQAYRDAHNEAIKQRVQEEMELDAERLEDLIRHYDPIAKATKVEVSRVNAKGEPYTDDEWKYSLQAGVLLKDLIAEKAKLFGYAKSEGSQSIINNHAFFLSGEKSFVDQIVSSQPIELESPAESLDLSFDLSFSS